MAVSQRHACGGINLHLSMRACVRAYVCVRVCMAKLRRADGCLPVWRRLSACAWVGVSIDKTVRRLGGARIGKTVRRLGGARIGKTVSGTVLRRVHLGGQHFSLLSGNILVVIVKR